MNPARQVERRGSQSERNEEKLCFVCGGNGGWQRRGSASAIIAACATL